MSPESSHYGDYMFASRSTSAAATAQSPSTIQDVSWSTSLDAAFISFTVVPVAIHASIVAFRHAFTDV